MEEESRTLEKENLAGTNPEEVEQKEAVYKGEEEGERVVVDAQGEKNTKQTNKIHQNKDQ